MPRVERALVTGMLLAFAGVVTVMVVGGAPLAYDEAVYAARAREFVTGEAAITWHAFRPPGLAVLGTVAAVTDWSDVALRLITLALALVALLGTWALARVIFGAGPALLALGAVAAAPAVLRAAPLFLNDLGSTGLVLISLAVLWTELERRPQPTWRLLLVAPLWAGAFYLRYGAVLVLLGIAVVTVALWWRTLARHWRLAGGVAVLGALLLVPHVVEAMTASGVPWGTLVDARTATRDAPLRTTVATYLGWLLDGTLAGPLGLALIVVGATVGPVLVVTRWRDASGGWEARGLLWIGLSALLVSVPIATSAAPEARYAFPPLFLGLIVGAKGALEAIAWLAARLQWPRMAPTARVALAVALLASFVASSAAAALDARRAATADGWRAEAARAITADSGGRCSLVVPWPLRPTFFWYTACPTIAGGGGEPPPTPWVEDGGTGYVVDHVAASEGRRIPDDVVAAYREVAASEPLVTYRASDGSEIAEVLRIER